jgi:protein SCO1/2
MNTAKTLLRTLVVIFGLAATGLILWRQTHKNKLTVNYGTVGEFSLTDQTGAPVTLASLKGHPWVANFIFTHCQGPCPLITYKTAQLQKEFSDASHLKFISFSVDPEHDTPTVLAAYAKSYDADSSRWHFLTGEKTKVYSVIRDSFKLAAEPASEKPGSAADFIHSTFFVLVDKDGRILGYYNSTDNEAFDRLRADLKKWT